jgi:enterochelin esterase-like enzyme
MIWFLLGLFAAAYPQDWTVKNPSVPAGHVEARTYPSKVFGGDRKISVYTPPGNRQPAGLLICLWGGDYIEQIPTPAILDNLMAAGKIPAMAAVFLDDDGDRFQDFQTTQKVAESVATELIPWVRSTLKIALEPKRTIVAGYSAAGLGSLYVAFAHPDAVGNVLAQSPAVWRGFDGTGASEPEWMSKQVSATPKRDVTFYLEVGGAETQSPGGIVFKEAVAHLRDALTRKGYGVSYKEVPGAKHEFTHWRNAFPDGLLTLTSAWPRQ